MALTGVPFAAMSLPSDEDACALRELHDVVTHAVTQLAIDAGARAIIQPGGSRRDAEVIEACDRAGVAMVFTARRHFRH